MGTPPGAHAYRHHDGGARHDVGSLKASTDVTLLLYVLENEVLVYD